MNGFDDRSAGTGNDSNKDDSSSGGDAPILTNRDEGVAAWINQDKNDNAYIAVNLPLGLGTVNLFPSNDGVREALNLFYGELRKRGDVQ